LNPDNYSGSLSIERSNQWKNVSEVYIINGHVEKADANFVGDLKFDKIGNTSIYLGPYP
jgi:hypothetical protein